MVEPTEDISKFTCISTSTYKVCRIYKIYLGSGNADYEGEMCHNCMWARYPKIAGNPAGGGSV